MGIGAADQGHVQGARDGEVVDVLGLAREEGGVLLALEALAHHGAHAPLLWLGRWPASLSACALRRDGRPAANAVPRAATWVAAALTWPPPSGRRPRRAR